ncbi:MAG TPA: MFS transporter [Candidatus Nitrosotenuis sp.]|nr:MFS transporter [Candidatus Nitrosotenuis sp.]
MNNKRTLMSAMIGNALEYYDVTLYGFFALIVSPLYFPSDDPLTSRITALGAFAMGFIARPLGGLIFGHIGDKWGRKRALVISILLATIPTFTIGVLPAYEIIGLWAPIILIGCRLVQGLCTAGEYSGASILIAEINQDNRRLGFACSLLPASSLLGACCGTGIGALVTLEFMPSWAWRIPFLLSLFVGAFGFYLRHQLDESPAFKQASSGQKLEKFPLLKVLKTEMRHFLCAIGIGSACISFFYILMVYVISLVEQTKNSLFAHHSMLLNMGVMAMWMLFLPLMGYLSDKIGIKRLMSIGATLMMTGAIPLFWYLHQEPTMSRIFLVMLFLTALGSAFVGPSCAFLATYLFPTEERYTGVAFGVNLGEAIFGASTPLVVFYLMSLTNNSHTPALYLIFCSFIGLISVRLTRTKGHEMKLGLAPKLS